MPVEYRKVNKLILEKVEKSSYPEDVKNFVKDILAFERNNSNLLLARYKNTYKDAAGKYFKGGEGK